MIERLRALGYECSGTPTHIQAGKGGRRFIVRIEPARGHMAQLCALELREHAPRKGWSDWRPGGLGRWFGAGGLEAARAASARHQRLFGVGGTLEGGPAGGSSVTADTRTVIMASRPAQ